jgi:hypothetical protein
MIDLLCSPKLGLAILGSLLLYYVLSGARSDGPIKPRPT